MRRRALRLVRRVGVGSEVSIEWLSSQEGCARLVTRNFGRVAAAAGGCRQWIWETAVESLRMSGVVGVKGAAQLSLRPLRAVWSWRVLSWMGALQRADACCGRGLAAVYRARVALLLYME
ncbi:hypothetical protein HBI14_134370 [Parastagonospora nodorum]|nr:hypothetical protein HBI14_134370 [Parastagonospora nodorum]